MEKAKTIMDCNRSEHPVQDCESSRPNHTLAPHCNSLTAMGKYTCVHQKEGSGRSGVKETILLRLHHEKCMTGR
ncbi:hypothetical protein QQF64_008697 [Cirrhinus molitorella]|uniref:Uncharacterized protein n=1 Tax=Cirrhinus molitorella TaxID=172907 RepID=A0ABR3M6W6_9TELE